VFVCLVKQHPTRKQYKLLSKFEEAPLAVLGSMKTDIAGSMKPNPTSNHQPQHYYYFVFVSNKNVINMKRTMIDLVFSLSFPQVDNTNCPDKLSRVSCPHSKVRKGQPTSPDNHQSIQVAIHLL